MSTHTHTSPKKHVGYNSPIVMKMRSKYRAGSSEINSRSSKVAKMQSALPVARQGESQSQEQLNVVFVVNAILKMGFPVSMADNDVTYLRLLLVETFKTFVMEQYNEVQHGD